jgi:mannose-6-phosphate isomerase-like protein (cupin superfamily)
VRLDIKISRLPVFSSKGGGRHGRQDQPFGKVGDVLGLLVTPHRSSAQHLIVKVKGEFVWHKHGDTDDFFLILRGNLDIQLRDRTVSLGPGEMFIVPSGVEHRPVAQEEVHMLLIEPSGTPNTGDKRTAAPRKTA